MRVEFGRLREIFLAAVEQHDREHWPEFLDRACAGDRELRSQAEMLLAAHLEGERLDPRGAAGAGGARPVEGSAERLGTMIGPYKLVEQIGDGGMGTVYMAEQTRPIQRLVALKIIKPGMDSRQVIARFEAERQALALMDHPNIAKVLDAGATESGQPYFVMELIKGVPITRFCDDRQLTLRERLDLCVPVCQAIQHAHQKGIIHRDVKPSNVLIALYDDKPVPKVIDFGVAKAVREPLTERTLHTGFGAIIGTLEYMSPEQAELNQLDVDTRSDVYGLGVLLYELLTGTTPIQRAQLQRSANLEILRLIREEDPQTPSTRLETTEELAAIAAKRGIEPRRLSGIVRGELDWIVMKCLEKDRARRYESADGLARDLQHYLSGEPVEACPPSATYRLRKFAGKNRRLLATVAGFLVLLIAGAVTASVLAIRATRAETRAREQADIAQQIIGFLENDLLSNPGAAGGSDQDLKLRTVLDRAEQRVEDAFKNRPLVQAGLDNTLGVAYLSLGEYAIAERHLRRVVETYQRILGPDQRDTLGARNNLAILHFRQGRLAEARKDHEEILAARRATLGPENKETLQTINGLTNVLLAQGKFEDARKLVEEELPVARRVLGEDESSTLNAMTNLARAYGALGRFDDARALDETLLATCKRKFGPTHMRTVIAMNNLATILRQQKKLDEARPLYEEALEAKRRTLGPEHPSTLVAVSNLADLDLTAGRLAEARALWEQALPIQRRVEGPEHTDTLRSMLGLAVTLNRLGERGKARSLYEETLASQRRALGPEHPDALLTMNRLADLDHDEDRAAEARALYDQVLAGYRKVLGPKHPTTLELTRNLAWFLVTSPHLPFRDPAHGLELANAALEATPEDGSVWNTVGVANYRLGRWSDAVTSLRKSMELRKGGDSDDFFFLAMAHWQLKERDQARDWYGKAVDWMEKNQPNNAELKRFRTEAERLMRPATP